MALILDVRGGHGALGLGLGLDLADFGLALGVNVDHVIHELEEVLTEDCHLSR